MCTSKQVDSQFRHSPGCHEDSSCNCPLSATVSCWTNTTRSYEYLTNVTCRCAFLAGGETSVASVLYRAKADMCFLSILLTNTSSKCDRLRLLLCFFLPIVALQSALYCHHWRENETLLVPYNTLYRHPHATRYVVTPDAIDFRIALDCTSLRWLGRFFSLLFHNVSDVS